MLRVLWPGLLVSLLILTAIATKVSRGRNSTCILEPLGDGQDDTDQIEAAIMECGQYGSTIFAPGVYNVTRKMTWNLTESRIDLHGYLNFTANLPYWMDPENTYRVIFIQSQASWFVITGSDFIIDAHNTGGIIGNGQYWWNWYGLDTRYDGDGRPVSLTVYRAKRGTVANFRIEGQPFWCNAIAESQDFVYDGMYCNATNTNPHYFYQNAVPNTDGIDTFRSDNIIMRNWDITLGDDCLAIKGNSTNIYAQNITCRGGNGIAFGSLGQYRDLFDHVENVTMEDLHMVHLDSKVQPNMGSGAYFKSWTGTTIGFPPIDGGGGLGLVTNITIRNMVLDNVSLPMHIYQTNGGLPGDAPSKLQFANITFSNWTGTSSGNVVVDFECSPAAPCPGMAFQDINITVPSGEPEYVCLNVTSETGLPGCNATVQS
ncbi:glycoside hydrolase family 28 protein [Laetiporus sulphureus 93-53]|uniref:galacturonan 1,4-alpha-galacturonidase n=1 Tax=Laetiporus sulphureus 93-53 TaxID=1314785 RepID=A0A165BCC6_9APHY|nr:glycoside hydrolase family 28 protein [Laetiporus sulphureus 93-53]KZT00729.1 glycoside hydrolase family 28 protein [Laetiporus sulphureus 93-53]